MNPNLTCIIIDDEPMSLKLIKSYIDNIPYISEIGCFDDAAEARQFLECNDVDILYTDIQMPDISGLELVKSLPAPPCVILVSAHRDFAPEGFEVEAVDYLVKPVSFSRFEKATERARNIISKRIQNSKNDNAHLNFLFVKNGADYVKVLIERILYFEAKGDYVLVLLASGEKILWRITMKELESTLPDNVFVRIHKSYIANLNNISKLLQQTVILSNDIELPISDSYKNLLKRKMGIR